MNKQEKIEKLKKENKVSKLKSCVVKLASILTTLGLMNLSVWALMRATILSSQFLTVLGAIGVTCSPVAILSAGLLIAGKWDKKVEENEKQIEIMKENLFSEEKTEENKFVYQAIKDLANNVSSKGYQPAQKNKGLIEDNNSQHGLTN